jgi:hypothetical protein
MADREVTLPEPSPEDDEDVVWGLSTARTLWARGERADAIVWLRRAAEAATAAGQDFRASQLGICASELEDAITASATPPAEAPTKSDAEPETEVDVERELTPPAPPAPSKAAPTAPPLVSAPKAASSAPPSVAPAAPRARPMSPWAQTLASPPSIPTTAAPAPSVVVQAPPPVTPAPPAPVAAFEAPAPSAAPAAPAQKPTVSSAPPSVASPPSAAAKPPQSTTAPAVPPPLAPAGARPKPKPRAPILDPWTVDPPSSASPASTAAEDPPSAARRPPPPPPPIGSSGAFVEVRTRPSSDDDDVVTSAAPLETTLGRKPRPPAPPPPPPPTRKPTDLSPVSTPRPDAPPPPAPPAPASSAQPAPPPPPPHTQPNLAAPPPASAHAAEGPAALGEARVAVPSKRPPQPPPESPAPKAEPSSAAPPPPPAPPAAPSVTNPPKHDAPQAEATPSRAVTPPPASPPEPAPAAPTADQAAADAPERRSLAGVSLDDVPALADLPEDMQDGLVASARVAELAVDEELSGFGAALVLDGSAFVCATIVDVAAMTAEPRTVIAPRGSLADPIALRIVAGANGTRLAVWEAPVFDAALDPCPWVRDEIRDAADRIQALAGATMGPLGELDDPTREGSLARLEARVLEPGEVLVARGGAALGVVLVGVGTLDLADDAGATTQTLKSGELLFPGSALDGSAAPATARAGQGGAIVLTSDRKTAGALFAEFPSLLELFSS